MAAVEAAFAPEIIQRLHAGLLLVKLEVHRNNLWLNLILTFVTVSIVCIVDVFGFV